MNAVSSGLGAFLGVRRPLPRFWMAQHTGGEAATGREALLVPDATQDPSLVSPHPSC